MKNLDLNSLGVREMNTLEMQETDGGIIWLFVLAAAALLTSSCVQNNNVTFIFGTGNSSSQATKQVNDSTLNGNNLEIPLDVPIGY